MDTACWQRLETSVLLTRGCRHSAARKPCIRLILTSMLCKGSALLGALEDLCERTACGACRYAVLAYLGYNQDLQRGVLLLLQQATRAAPGINA